MTCKIANYLTYSNANYSLMIHRLNFCVKHFTGHWICMEVLARDSMLRGAIVTMHVFYQIAARIYSYAFVMILKREQKANVYTYIRI